MIAIDVQQSLFDVLSTSLEGYCSPINPTTIQTKLIFKDFTNALVKYQCHGETPHSEDLFCTVLKKRTTPSGQTPRCHITESTEMVIVRARITPRIPNPSDFQKGISRAISNCNVKGARRIKRSHRKIIMAIAIVSIDLRGEPFSQKPNE